MFITPKISKEEAEKILSQRKSFFPVKLRKNKPLPLKRTEIVYLPFYLFEVVCRHEEREQKVSISLDGLLGDNLFFFKENMEFKEKVQDPVCPFDLPETEAQTKALDKYKWFQIEHRFRMKEKFEIGEISGAKKIFYPFWVGYFKRGKGYDFRLLDAVSGALQGVRMRKVFLKALRQL